MSVICSSITLNVSLMIGLSCWSSSGRATVIRVFGGAGAVVAIGGSGIGVTCSEGGFAFARSSTSAKLASRPERSSALVAGGGITGAMAIGNGAPELAGVACGTTFWSAVSTESECACDRGKAIDTMGGCEGGPRGAILV